MSEIIERVAQAIHSAVGQWQPRSGNRIRDIAARAAIEEVRDYLKGCGCDTGSAIHHINKSLSSPPRAETNEQERQ